MGVASTRPSSRPEPRTDGTLWPKKKPNSKVKKKPSKRVQINESEKEKKEIE
jgi:hypothetical protein